MKRGGPTANVPPEAQPDPGWGHDPREAWHGLQAALDGKLRRCDAGQAALARGRAAAQPIWCREGPIRNLALMQQAWIERRGQMPPPRPLKLPKLDFDTPEQGYAQFMQHLGLKLSGDWVQTASGDEVFVDDALFRTIDGYWKIKKRGRNRWLLYLAELIKQPQEVWRLRLAQTEELYLLGRFQRERQRLDAIAVFRRDTGSASRWPEGKTAYVFDSDDGFDSKRAMLMRKASLRWL